MRTGVIIALCVLGLWTILTGILDSDVHVIAACASIAVMCIHLWLNRKPFLQRFKGLGWRWMLVGLGLLAVFATAAID